MSLEASIEQKQSALRIERIEEAMRLQNPQLELLRQLGIATMIEKEAGAEIPLLVFEDNSTQSPKADLKRTSEMIIPTVILRNGLFTEGWSLNPIPQQRDNGLPDTTLRIRAYRITNQQVEPFATRDVQSVLITFTQERHLQVVGDEITFDGDLAVINDQPLTHVQAGIKEAFSNPYIEPESATGWHLE